MNLINPISLLLTFFTIIVFLLTVATANTEEIITLKTELLNSQPKFIMKSDGNFTGLCVDLMELIEKNSNFRFYYQKDFTPTGRAEVNLKNSLIDVHFGFSRTPEREKDIIFLIPLYEIRYIIIARRDDPFTPGSIEDIKKMRDEGVVLTLLGTGIADYAKSLGLHVDAGSGNLEANLNKLLHGRGKFLIYHDLGLFYKLRDSRYKGLFKVLPIDLEKSPQWFVVSRGLDERTRKDLLGVIKKLKKSPEWNKITRKYIAEY
jgi:ABC-type amino acid transport substrate-binding protein